RTPSKHRGSRRGSPVCGCCHHGGHDTSLTGRFEYLAKNVRLAARRLYPGYAVTELMPDQVFPVCSPRLLAQRGPVDTVEALLDLPLLHDSATDGDGQRLGLA